VGPFFRSFPASTGDKYAGGNYGVVSIPEKGHSWGSSSLLLLSVGVEAEQRFHVDSPLITQSMH